MICPTSQQRIAGLPDEGTVIDGKYKIQGVLGAGGMAAVYRAEHTKIGRIVALKFLLPDFREQPELVQRVEREARAAGTIDHANVVEIVDLGSTEAFGPYIAMEMLKGEDLATYAENHGMVLPPLDAADIVRQVLSALAVAHDKGVIHRDLKPENIFLADDEGRLRVKVLDFGISKLTEKHGVSRLTRVGTVMGTPQFMAPEQAVGAANQDHRADIYACGVVLYALLTGALPYDAENFNVLISDMLNKPPAPVLSHNSELDPELAAIVMKAIERKPEDRYATAREMQDALVIWMKHAPVDNPAHRPSFSESIRMRFPSAVPQTVRASKPTLDDIIPQRAQTAAPTTPSAANPSDPEQIGELPTMMPGDVDASLVAPESTSADATAKRGGRTGLVVALALILGVGGGLFATRTYAPAEWNRAARRAGLQQFAVPGVVADAGAPTRPRSEHHVAQSETSQTHASPSHAEHTEHSEPTHNVDSGTHVLASNTEPTGAHTTTTQHNVVHRPPHRPVHRTRVRHRPGTH